MSTGTREEIVAKAGAAAPAAPPQAPPAPPAAPEMPDELRARVAETSDDLLNRVRSGMRRSLDRRRTAQQRAAGAELGEPTVGDYVAFDLYAFTPVQFIGPPPYQPSKIIAGGEFAVVYAVLFVNPTIDIASGFAVQPTVQLSDRTYRVCMEQVNLTNVTDGPDALKEDKFSAPAPDLTLLAFPFVAPDPGNKPRLMEANLSADIVGGAQPYAAFASTIIDVDNWLVQQNIPLRYLVYPK